MHLAGSASVSDPGFQCVTLKQCCVSGGLLRSIAVQGHELCQSKLGQMWLAAAALSAIF